MMTKDEVMQLKGLLKTPKPPTPAQPVFMQMSDDLRKFQQVLELSIKVNGGAAGASELEKILGKK